MKCSTCSMELEPVFDLTDAEVTRQFDNVLVLHVEGGYGMFTDDLNEDSPVFLLCHECAHLFCKIFDPEKKLINPFLSHSHKADTVADSHDGWDRKYR